MIDVDPLEGAWEEPQRLIEWGNQCSPPLELPWLSQINFERSPVDILSVGRLLLPEFTVFNQGVFLKMQFNEKSYQQWSKKFDDLSSIERMINHAHVYDLFGQASDASEEEFLLVAKLMQRTWFIALSLAFPDSQFDVLLSNSEQDYGPTITFQKIRN